MGALLVGRVGLSCLDADGGPPVRRHKVPSEAIDGLKWSGLVVLYAGRLRRR